MNDEGFGELVLEYDPTGSMKKIEKKELNVKKILELKKKN